MPKREDERNANLSGKHPAYCTCTGCAEGFLRKRGIKRGKTPSGEKVRSHPRDCRCATCQLLSSVGDLPAQPRRRGGFFSRLLGRG